MGKELPALPKTVRHNAYNILKPYSKGIDFPYPAFPAFSEGVAGKFFALYGRMAEILDLTSPNGLDSLINGIQRARETLDQLQGCGGDRCVEGDLRDSKIPSRGGKSRG